METETAVPVSYAQRRLWFFEKLQPGSAIYNIHMLRMLPGTIDSTAVSRILGEIVRRHEALRTAFPEVDGEPAGLLHPPSEFPVAFVDLSGQPEEARSREMHRLAAENRDRGFDVERGPLLRAVLIKVEPHRLALSLCVHHIVFDDWSAAVFSREFTTLQDDLRAGRPFSLPPPASQYPAYAATQRARFEAGSTDPKLRYWLDRLAGLPATSELPTGRPRPAAQTFKGATRVFDLARSTADGLRDLTRASDVTLFMSLFAVFALLLHRHANQADIAIGTPATDRGRPEFEDLIGFFVATLVLRVDFSDDPSFATLLVRVREAVLGALAHREVPFERLVEELRPERDPSRQPLFQTMFVFQYGGLGGEDTTGDADAVGAKFDLTLTAVDAAPRIRLSFDYNVDLFAPETVALFAERFDALAAAAVAAPDRPVSELAVLGAPERARVVDAWNGTDAPLPPPVTAQVAAVAARAPDAPALAAAGETVSYGALLARADALAAELRARGVGPEVRVGLCARRSPAWAVALLGILRAGGALVPLDPALPAERLGYMAGDAGLALAMVEPGLEDRLGAAGVPTMPLAGDGSDASADGAGPPAPSSLAYVIYTSGSTGRPKGVMVEHAGLANLALAQARAWGVGPGSRVLQFAAPGFDAALSEVFSTLCVGGCLHVAEGDDLIPGPPLLATLRERRITHVTLPPSALAAMAPEGLPDLGLIVAAGEACDAALAARWAQGRRLVNAYGPTEIAVCATMGAFDPATGEFPIGQPIANVRVYVLDRHGAPVPPGVAGEIHVGGAGVARGYLNQPDLTAERFVPDAVSGRPGRLYRTGDLGRFDNHGTLHYLGRLDRQLKVRGYRIEPGEVESVLRRHPQVADAAVLGLGTGPDARLIAYVIPRGTPPLAVELRAFAAGLLPDYMAPAAYVTVDAWPKTPNGKIDHAALPRPDSLARQARAAYAAPQGETEARVAAIWRECLGVSAVGGDDNFFDLGGHSLLLVKVHGRLRAELGSALSLVDLFRFPTVRLLAAALKQDAAGHAGAEAAALGRADQRAAQQNAARLRRRRPTGANNA
ncbi:non-ribosomal peptide synthetase [Lichenibacterium dinghuense]|uniref:non-ribosomal peptide synthetase n=1 Tax=Lichenibacterium dinghuense TaxID=2895977 RepID=UPI001F44D5D6|nr:amino acid adenylation domain-containing protein [Lichenibacterium sp. 6Y81]